MTNSDGIRAVVFDMDGVLIEARDWHYEALNRALGHFGWNISRADHLTTFNGLPTRDKLDILTRTQGLPRELHGFLNRLKQRYTRELIVTCCEPTYNHRYCLSKLAADGYALACASNSIRQTIVDILQLAALDTYLPLVVSNEDVTKAKPAPEIYLTACARLGLHPSQVLVVEDSEHGIAAARASGCHVLVVADPDDVTYDRVVAAIAHANAELAVLEVAAWSTLVLAAGGSKPYQDAGYPYPKELAELDGQPLIEHVLTRLGSLTREPLVVVVDSHADKKFCIADVVRLVVPTAASIRAGATSGALCSALLAIGDVSLDQDLLIVNGDQFLDVELDQIVADWRRSDLDAATVVFDATHPRWSYVRVDAEGLVVEAAEKRPISRLATAGTYWFRRATDFFDAAQTMILQSAAHGEAFFICPALNELVLAGKRIGVTRIEQDAYHSFKYPDELKDYVREQARQGRRGHDVIPVDEPVDHVVEEASVLVEVPPTVAPVAEDRFGGHYRMWRTRRIKAIIDHYGPTWFVGKTVLELGCGYGDIGMALVQLGADVTFSDGRQEHLDQIAEWYPEIDAASLVRYDAEQPWPFTERFDLVLHLGLLYHVDRWEDSLAGALASTDRLVLETEVCDSDDPTLVVKTVENGYDQALGGIGSRPSGAAIEALLVGFGCRFDRVTDARCNANIHRYDWPVTNTGRWEHGQRRFWFVDRAPVPGLGVARLEDMVRGWFVGAFEPTALHTDSCEVAIRWYEAGSTEEVHHHRVATETTAVVAGSVRMCGRVFDAGSIVTLAPGTATAFEALKDSLCVVVKTPGALGDKYLGAPS